MSYTLIERKELSSSASSILFENIPQFYTDLVVQISARSNRSLMADGIKVYFNGSTTGFTGRRVYGDGLGGFGTDTLYIGMPFMTATNATSNTFGNATLYIPNYSGNINKSFYINGAAETNANATYLGFGVGLWSNTAPINSVSISPEENTPLVAGSTFSLYGINRQQAIGAPKAIGGAISFANGHWVHTFTGSGTFTSLENLTDVDYLVVAGGGAGGVSFGAGGGAGGLVTGKTSLAAASYRVAIGAGGSGTINDGTPFRSDAIQGNNSIFSTFTALKGGGGGGNSNISHSVAGGDGVVGSGGGGQGKAFGPGAIGTPGQGNNGGNGSSGASGGGGGAGSGGGNASSTIGGNAGNGLQVGWTGTSTWFAPGAAGVGTGGSGSAGNQGGTAPTVAGAENTGAGGGADTNAPGGSGIVIIRYKA